MNWILLSLVLVAGSTAHSQTRVDRKQKGQNIRPGREPLEGFRADPDFVFCNFGLIRRLDDWRQRVGENDKWKKDEKSPLSLGKKELSPGQTAGTYLNKHALAPDKLTKEQLDVCDKEVWKLLDIKTWRQASGTGIVARQNRVFQEQIIFSGWSLSDKEKLKNILLLLLNAEADLYHLATLHQTLLTAAQQVIYPLAATHGIFWIEDGNPPSAHGDQKLKWEEYKGRAEGVPPILEAKHSGNRAYLQEIIAAMVASDEASPKKDAPLLLPAGPNGPPGLAIQYFIGGVHALRSCLDQAMEGGSAPFIAPRSDEQVEGAMRAAVGSTSDKNLMTHFDLGIENAMTTGIAPNLKKAKQDVDYLDQKEFARLSLADTFLQVKKIHDLLEWGVQPQAAGGRPAAGGSEAAPKPSLPPRPGPARSTTSEIQKIPKDGVFVKDAIYSAGGKFYRGVLDTKGGVTLVETSAPHRQ